MKLGLLYEIDERIRHLERLAAAGDPIALERLKQERFRAGMDDRRYLTPVRTFCMSDLPEGFTEELRWFGRHAVESLIHSQISGVRVQDLQLFDMVDSQGNNAGVCFIDRKRKIPDEGMSLNVDPGRYPFNRVPPERREELSRSWNVRMVPVEGWLLTIYHFGSVEDARQHYRRLYSGTQRRIAYRKLESGTIGLSSQNPPDWPINKNGFPYKSKREAIKWASKKLHGVRAVGAKQGPELKVNWQFLFVR